jgi:hypothetical protein
MCKDRKEICFGFRDIGKCKDKENVLRSSTRNKNSISQFFLIILTVNYSGYHTSRLLTNFLVNNGPIARLIN